MSEDSVERVGRRGFLRRAIAAGAGLVGLGALGGAVAVRNAGVPASSEQVGQTGSEGLRQPIPEFAGIENILPEGRCTRENSVVLCDNYRTMDAAQSSLEPVFHLTSVGEGFRLPSDGKLTQGSSFYTAGLAPDGSPLGGASLYAGLTLLKSEQGKQFVQVGLDLSDRAFTPDTVGLQVTMADGSKLEAKIAGYDKFKRWEDKGSALYLQLSSNETPNNLPQNVIPLPAGLNDIREVSLTIAGQLQGRNSSVQFNAARRAV